MAEDNVTVIEVEYANLVERCYAWTGDATELKELGLILQACYNDDEAEALEDCSLILLENDMLPTFYKAKMHAYLSACPEQDRIGRMLTATSWISQASAEAFTAIGFVPEEIEKWRGLIRNQLAEYQGTYASEGPLLGAFDGTNEVEGVGTTCGGPVNAPPASPSQIKLLTSSPPAQLSVWKNTHKTAAVKDSLRQDSVNLTLRSKKSVFDMRTERKEEPKEERSFMFE
ncbi:hypothetical protein LTS10_011625 [Elasticomyces elasticus]|nr:hypothetical protein LTS10_011625 [Elasticomyces elasticus]